MKNYDGVFLLLLVFGTVVFAIPTKEDAENLIPPDLDAVESEGTSEKTRTKRDILIFTGDDRRPGCRARSCFDDCPESRCDCHDEFTVPPLCKPYGPG